MTVPDRDTGALIGLTIAFLGVFLGRVFDNEYLDGVASLLIGLTLGLMAVFLAYETKGLLIGEGLDRETLAQLRAIITRDKAVQHIERLLTHYFGPDDVLLTVEVRFREELSSREIASQWRGRERVQQALPEWSVTPEVKSGSPAHEVLKLAQEWQADLNCRWLAWSDSPRIRTNRLANAF